jgi:CubicO group peptidase (beta-lactamase class C family)
MRPLFFGTVGKADGGRLRAVLAQGVTDRRYPAATALITRAGVAGPVVAAGAAAPDTIFDLASVSKLFTTVVVLSLVDRGALDLDAPIGRYLPGLAPETGELSPRRLLTHTGGLPPEERATHGATPERARALVMAVRPEVPPGSGHRYSDLGPVLAGWVAEAVAGEPLDALVHRYVTGPLGLVDTGYRPDPGVRHRIAPTEYGTGVVHDEMAAALGGVAGHAGIFATAADLARFGEALRTGALLSPESTAEMRRDQLPGLPIPGYRQGLGARLSAPSFMGPLAGYGHTGFTGTSIVVDPARQLTVVLLTNRVHPRRDGPGVEPVRRAVSELAAGSSSA